MIIHSAAAADSDSGVFIGDSSDGSSIKLLVHGMRQDCTGKGLAAVIRQHLQKFCQVIHVSVRRNAALRVRGGFVVLIRRKAGKTAVQMSDVNQVVFIAVYENNCSLLSEMYNYY